MIVLLLLAWAAGGAIVNVAVAWGCAMWSAGSLTLDREAPRSAIALPRHWPPPEHRARGERGLGYWSASTAFDVPAGMDPRSAAGEALDVFMTGWPCLALYAERHRMRTWSGYYGPMLFGDPESFGEGIVMPRSLSDWHWSRCLPTQPNWPGFAINSVFYAAILWGGGLLSAAPFALRRRRRIRRGLCPKCAYPIGTWGGDACTECGQPVKPRA